MISMGRASIAFLVLMQIGCVLYDRRISLVDPSMRVAGRGGWQACAAGKPALTVKIVDGRGRPMPVGAVRNGFYIAMADVVTQDDLGVWVTGAISNELRRQGECLADLRYEAARPPTARRIDVTGGLTRAWADAFYTYWGDVILQVTISDGSGRSINKTYAGHATNGMNWGATEESYARVLNLALADAVSQLVRDLKTKIMTELSLPPPPPPAAGAGQS
jgi:hypothetical protein